MNIVEFLGLELAQLEAALIPDVYVVCVQGAYINYEDGCTQARPLTATRFNSRSDAVARIADSFGGLGQPVLLAYAVRAEMAQIRALIKEAA